MNQRRTGTVLFNDPVPCPDPAARAVRLAVAMRKAVAALSLRWARRGHRIGFGVGIAQGYATIGRIGFEGRFDYSAIGTVANLAARLCSKAQDGQILVSERVAAAVEEIAALEPIGEVQLKGLAWPVAARNVHRLLEELRPAGRLLGLAGLRVGIFEREPSLHPQPRAGHFDGEVMRVFQTIGLAEEIQPDTFVSPGMRFVNGRGELLLDWPRPQEIGPDGWHASYRFHQPDLERSLRTGVARFDGVEARLRREIFAVDEAPDHVVLRYENLATGALEKATARYVIGCDGARPRCR